MYKELYAKQCRQEKLESGERNEVEGEFGTGKRSYGLDRLTARLKETCETRDPSDIYGDESVEEIAAIAVSIFRFRIAF